MLRRLVARGQGATGHRGTGHRGTGHRLTGRLRERLMGTRYLRAKVPTGCRLGPRPLGRGPRSRRPRRSVGTAGPAWRMQPRGPNRPIPSRTAFAANVSSHSRGRFISVRRFALRGIQNPWSARGPTGRGMRSSSLKIDRTTTAASFSTLPTSRKTVKLDVTNLEVICDGRRT